MIQSSNLAISVLRLLLFLLFLCLILAWRLLCGYLCLSTILFLNLLLPCCSRWQLKVYHLADVGQPLFRAQLFPRLGVVGENNLQNVYFFADVVHCIDYVQVVERYCIDALLVFVKSVHAMRI